MSHVPCPTGKEVCFCLIEAIPDHGEVYGIKLTPVPQDCLEHDLVWEVVHKFAFLMKTVAIKTSNQKET